MSEHRIAAFGRYLRGRNTPPAPKKTIENNLLMGQSVVVHLDNLHFIKYETIVTCGAAAIRANKNIFPATGKKQAQGDKQNTSLGE